MAILNRGGLEADLDKSKMLPRETVVTTDTKKVFTAFAPGEVEQMATVKEMNEAITEVTEDIITEVTEGISTAIENAETATANANTAVSDANGALITANGIIDTVTQNNTDMEVAEGNRVTAEETRELNEDARISNEIDRQEFYTAYQMCEPYDNVKPYVVGNKVTYNGSTYQCIADCTDILPTNTINWICIAEKGLDGTGTGDMTASTYDPQGKATDIFAYVGDKTTLATSNKADLVSAINETFQSVSDGKSTIASAITDKGVITNPTDTFAEMAENIGTIETSPVLSGDATVDNVLSGKTFYKDNADTKLTGTMPNNEAVTITPSTTNKAISKGYHNGDGYVLGDANLISENIKSGVSVFGVDGSVASGKKSASGVAESVWTFFKVGDGGNVGENGITVAGLTFKASVVIIYNPTKPAKPVVYISTGVIAANGGAYPYTPIFNTERAIGFQETGNAYVNSAGFQLPAPGSGTWNWIAYE